MLKIIGSLYTPLSSPIYIWIIFAFCMRKNKLKNNYYKIRVSATPLPFVLKELPSVIQGLPGLISTAGFNPQLHHARKEITVVWKAEFGNLRSQMGFHLIVCREHLVKYQEWGRSGRRDVSRILGMDFLGTFHV